MKITPLNQQSSSEVVVAVVADEENVLSTKDFDTAPRDDDEATPRSLTSTRWSVIVGVIALIAVIVVATPLLLLTRNDSHEEAAVQIQYAMNLSGNNTETRVIKTITANGLNGNCSIDEDGSSITYTPNEGFVGTDSCSYIVMVCGGNAEFCDYTEETVLLSSPATATLGGSKDIGQDSQTVSSTTPSTTTEQTTTLSDDEKGATTAARTDNPCIECSITNDKQNFCGQLGIDTFVDACSSQTDCKERGLKCQVCNVVDGFDGYVGSGAYICVDDELDASKVASGAVVASATATVATAVTSVSDPSPLTTTSTSSTPTSEASGIASLNGTVWEATGMMWLTDSSFRPTTEEDRNPIILEFKSDTRVSGTCGNNKCWNEVSFTVDQLEFDKFGRTRMVASEQENNYVTLLEENKFFYDVWDDGNNDLPELHLYEIIFDDGGFEQRGRLMVTYVLSEGEINEEV